MGSILLIYLFCESVMLEGGLVAAGGGRAMGTAGPRGHWSRRCSGQAVPAALGFTLHHSGACPNSSAVGGLWPVVFPSFAPPDPGCWSKALALRGAPL